MVIEQTHAISIEHTVRSALGCDRFGYGGCVNSDVYRKNPLEAAIICIGHLYRGSFDKEIGEFFTKWRTVFTYPEDNQEYKIEDYILELKTLIKLIK